MKLGTCNMRQKMGKEKTIKLKDGNTPYSILHAPSESVPCSMFLAPCKGFTLLFAVLLGSLLFSLGLAISHIAVREVVLSSSGKSSEIAFYAADAGIECALYSDMQKKSFPKPGDKPKEKNNIECNGKDDITVGITSEVDPDASIVKVSSFIVSFSPVCAEVRVEKRLSGTMTTIESRGRNDCNEGKNPGRVERALRVKY